MEIMTRLVLKSESCHTCIDYEIHIKTKRNKQHFEEEKNGDYAECLKYSVRIFVE
jgi:hypothetical protein